MEQHRQKFYKLSMNEAMALLADARVNRQTEIQRGMPSNDMGLTLNDEVINRTWQYLERFVQFKGVDVSNQVRRKRKQFKIDEELCIQIINLGLRDYDEAVGLFPKLKQYPKEDVQEIIEIIKMNSTTF